MKRLGYLFEKVIDEDNLRMAFINAAKGSSKRKKAKFYLDNIDAFIPLLKSLFVNDSFQPLVRNKFIIQEKLSNKVRKICSCRFFPDLVVQHALFQVLEKDVILKGSYPYSVASIKGRGIRCGKEYLEKVLKKNRARYCLKLDISKYYDSINPSILYGFIEKKIKDVKVLSIFKKIIFIQEKGIPIGFYSSQKFSELYLQSFDHFVKEELDIKYYVRYCDDLVLIDSNRRKLLKSLDRIIEFLNNLGLKIKDNWLLFRIDDENSVDFLGFKFFKSKTSIRKRIWKNIRRCLLDLKVRFWSLKLLQRFFSYWGYIKNSNCYYIKNFYLKNIRFEILKERIASYGA